MADKELVMKLAKLMIAGAWADGSLEKSEIHSLKDLLFTLPGVTGAEWKELDIYIDSPVDASETERLVGDVVKSADSRADKDLILDSLKALFEADGNISREETELLAQIREALDTKKGGLFASLGGAVKRLMGKRSEKLKDAPNREERIEDYIKNTVYYDLAARAEKDGIKIHLQDEQIEKLCIAAAIMTRVALADDEFSDEETGAIAEALESEWALPGPQARLVAEISRNRALKGLDEARMTRGFFGATNYSERAALIKCLFKIANASDKTSHEEIEHIRSISNALKVEHKDFIAAKTSIPNEDRGGL